MTKFSLYDEVLKYRVVARELHLALGRHPCTCVETEGYKDFQVSEAERRKDMAQEERLLDCIFAPDYDGEKLEFECERCRAMWLYESTIGDEAVDVELAMRQEAWWKGSQDNG